MSGAAGTAGRRRDAGGAEGSLQSRGARVQERPQRPRPPRGGAVGQGPRGARAGAVCGSGPGADFPGEAAGALCATAGETQVSAPRPLQSLGRERGQGLPAEPPSPGSRRCPGRWRPSQTPRFRGGTRRLCAPSARAWPARGARLPPGGAGRKPGPRGWSLGLWLESGDRPHASSLGQPNALARFSGPLGGGRERKQDPAGRERSRSSFLSSPFVARPCPPPRREAMRALGWGARQGCGGLGAARLIPSTFMAAPGSGRWGSPLTEEPRHLSKVTQQQEVEPGLSLGPDDARMVHSGGWDKEEPLSPERPRVGLGGVGIHSCCLSFSI